MDSNKLFKYWQWRTIIATMIGYALFYFVRKNFSFAIPGLSAEYGITKTSFGIIMTLITIVYGVSRFLNGLVADRLNARYHMAIGLLCSSVDSLDSATGIGYQDVYLEHFSLYRSKFGGYVMWLHHGYVGY